MKRISLEQEAAAVCDANCNPPLIFQLPPEEGREKLEEAQSTPVAMCPATAYKMEVDTGAWGTIPVYAVWPERINYCTDVIFYIHGAGWVFGSYHTHEKLVRELAYRTNSLIIFPEYSRSPEAKYPTAIEQCYYVMCRLPEIVKSLNLSMKQDTLTVAGDSVGGNMTIAMTLMAKFRNGPAIDKQLLYYPVTNACFNTESYNQFACGYYLFRAGMEWFWDQYTASRGDRCQLTASPLRADCGILKDLPQAMILNGQADVLRDEGEAYAVSLREAGVPVTQMRFQAIIHDFVMLNALDQTKACRAAMDVSTEWINRLNDRFPEEV